jgi:hypothetical protein
MKHITLLLVFLLTSCFQPEREVIYEVKNIATKQKAILTLTPAEFNVGDIYHVYILFEKETIKGNDYGIVFSANNWDNALPRDTSKIKMKWLTEDTLKISYNSKLRIYNQVIKTRDNVIIYEEMKDSIKTENSSR